MDKIVIWGASGHARVVADALNLGLKFSIVGFLDDTPAREGEEFGGPPVLGGRDVLTDLREHGVRHIHIAIGHCRARSELATVAHGHGFVLATVVHPRAIIAQGAPIGQGAFVAAGAIVGPNTRIGKNVILNTGCSVDHDCLVDDGAHVGPGVHIGGASHIGKQAWIGIGATLKDRVKVGDGAIVGAGSVVVRDIPPGVVAYGVPARVVRDKLPRE